MGHFVHTAVNMVLKHTNNLVHYWLGMLFNSLQSHFPTMCDKMLVYKDL